MIELKISFDKRTLLELTNEQIKQLASKGETETPVSHQLGYGIDERYPSVFLSYDSSLSSYFFEFKPEQDIDLFINCSYLTHYYPETGKVKLVEGLEEPLGDILLKKQFGVPSIQLLEKLKFAEQQSCFNDNLDLIAVKSLVQKGSFKGRISCCDCGIPGCSSEYLWAENNCGLASFHLTAGSLDEVQLFPFKLI